MRRFLIVLLLMIMTSVSANAAKIPNELENYISKTFPDTNFRFDGVIILSDTTLYLPLFPAKPLEVDEIQVKSTIPAGKTLAQKPEVIIFNNNYVLMKVINDKNGKKTVLSPSSVPVEIRNGLLPQDMLVPRGLMIPENLKGIIGNLSIETAEDTGLRVEVPQSKKVQVSQTPLPELKNKTFYIATGYNKNIQVVNSENKSPAYALSQNSVPNCIKGYDNKFLLVTSFANNTLNVISLADEQIIKQVHFATRPDEIVIDNDKKIAYISSSEDASIYIFNLETMTLSKQIKINGMCEKLTLSDDGSKIFYFDKKTNEIWAIELDNNYLLKDIGKFPNVSRIAFNNNKIYITSRTKNRLAIVDYDTNGLIAEVEITSKPVDMLAFENKLYILGAAENIVQVLDTKTDEITDTIYLSTNGFSTNLNPVAGTNLALVTDARASIYCVLDLKSKKVIKAGAIEVPIRSIVVTDRIKKIN